jgi:hypothetical protein
MKRTLTLVLVMTCGCAALFAQKKLKSLTLSDSVVYAAVDRPGDLYVITRNGQIQKFDIDGKLLRLFKNDPAPTLFDPRDGARLFAYYRHDQHYAFLNPSFEVTQAYRVDSAFVISPWLLCVSGDYNLWILDAADRSLKKINTSTSTTMVDTKIPENVVENFSDITFMREYQGFLFLLDQAKGIHIFNGIGIHIRSIESPSLLYFNFLGEELYYPDGDRLQIFNLFTTSTRTIDKLPGKYVLQTDERIFAINGTQIDFYRNK